MTNSTYTPPKVWTWDAENGGRFSKINRPIAGATHDKALPIGEHPLQLHSLGTPNGVKVTIMLEELLALGKDAEYDAFLINITEGSQFSSGSSNRCSNFPALNTTVSNWSYLVWSFISIVCAELSVTFRSIDFNL